MNLENNMKNKKMKKKDSKKMKKKGGALGKNIWWLGVAVMGFFVPGGAALVPIGFFAFLVMYTWDKHDESKAQAATPAPKVSSKEKSEEADDDKPIKCRFCKKFYGSEYNGCPYCKRK